MGQWCLVDGFDHELNGTVLARLKIGRAARDHLPRRCNPSWTQFLPTVHHPREHRNNTRVQGIIGMTGSLAAILGLAVMSCPRDQRGEMFTSSMVLDGGSRRWVRHNLGGQFAPCSSEYVEMLHSNAQ